jgi:alkaline phosphatase
METTAIVSAVLGLGFAGIVALAVAEKFVPLLPSYVLLLLLGMAIPDLATWVQVVAATTLGSVIGAAGWYGLGHWLGRRRVEMLVRRFGRYLCLSAPRYRQLTAAYRRHRFLATLLGQTIPGVRVYAGVPAGVLGFEYRSFLVATTLGTLIWNAPFLYLGFALRGSGFDPVRLGLAVCVLLIAAESALLYGGRVVFEAARGRRPNMPARASAFVRRSDMEPDRSLAAAGDLSWPPLTARSERR